GPEVGAVELELHAGYPDVVARAGCHGEGPRDRRPARGGRDGDGRRRRIVENGDGDGGGGRHVAGAIAGHGGQGVAGVGGGEGVPRYRVGRGRNLGPEVGAVELELHADDADVVAGAGRDAEWDGGRRAARGSCERDGRVYRVVKAGDGDGGGGRDVAGGITGHGGERVAAVGRADRVP